MSPRLEQSHHSHTSSSHQWLALTNAGGAVSDIWNARERGLASAIYATVPFLGPGMESFCLPEKSHALTHLRYLPSYWAYCRRVRSPEPKLGVALQFLAHVHILCAYTGDGVCVDS